MTALTDEDWDLRMQEMEAEAEIEERLQRSLDELESNE